MTTNPIEAAVAPELPVAAATPEVPVALEVVLEQNLVVKDKVDACASDLRKANDIVKQRIEGGETTLSAHAALVDSEQVESKVKECADDLHQVNESLAHGVEDLKHTEIALARSRRDLTDAQASLASSQKDEYAARLRAMHDAATGLPNRDLFNDRLDQAIAMAERHDWTLAVMFLDLDHFKKVNDTYGHAAGDRVLKEVAERLLQNARDEDTVCRNGGDEFLYLLVDPHGTKNIRQTAARVLKKIAQPIDFDGRQLVIRPSIGIAIYPEDGATGNQLIQSADAAMYQAKSSHNGCEFFSVLATLN